MSKSKNNQRLTCLSLLFPLKGQPMQRKCRMNASRAAAAASLHLVYFCLWLCPSCVRLLGVEKQVKGV